MNDTELDDLINELPGKELIPEKYGDENIIELSNHYLRPLFHVKSKYTPNFGTHYWCVITGVELEDVNDMEVYLTEDQTNLLVAALDNKCELAEQTEV